MAISDKEKHASKAAYPEGDLYEKIDWTKVPDPVEDGPEDKVVQLLYDEYEKYVISTHRFRGDRTVVIKREGLLEIVKRLKDDPELCFKFLTDLTAVDLLGKGEHRFVVVYHFFSFEKKMRLRLKVPMEESNPRLDSIASLYEAANWYEREAAEFFGLTFKGHPDPRKLFLYDEFKGCPLRKDYPYNKRQPLIEYRDVGFERHHYPGMRGSGTDIEPE